MKLSQTGSARRFYSTSIAIALGLFIVAVYPQCEMAAQQVDRLKQTESVGGAATTQAKNLPNEKGIGIEVAFPNLRFHRPVFLTHAGDERIFVIEQEGVVRVFQNDRTNPDNIRSSSVFLDIRDRVSRKGNEEGLIGFAFHPKFQSNGQLFAHYSSSKNDMKTTISRFRVDPSTNLVDAASEEIIFEVEQPFRNHNGGTIAFGQDNYLYISLGDGGKANDPLGSGQDMTSVLGKILRIDIDRTSPGLKYAIPEDNPFVERAGARGEIWALGLRNVWRFSFDRKTGDLWAGDVGQNRFDEVSLIKRGGNYGWNRWEASESFDDSTTLATERHSAPVAFYGREWGLSITGGNVYRGKRFPELDGSYFYGDYISGNLWRIRKDAEGEYREELVRRTGRSIASFGEDFDGEVYLLSFDGKIYRIVPTDEPENFLADWPEKVSETEIFSNISGRVVSDSYVPYQVNSPFWSDGAVKTRYLRLPEGAAMNYQSEGAWRVPVGTEIVKNFRDGYSRRMLETRVIKRTQTGWESATYIWDRKGTEAILHAEGQQFELWGRARPNVPQVRLWHGPSSSECASCHTEASGYVLGLRTAQLNDVDGEENQILRLKKLGWVSGLPDSFDPASSGRFCDPHAESGDLEERARVLLDVNCAMCHRPQGPGNSTIDLRHQVDLAATRMIDQPPAQGDLGIADAKLLARGKPDQSVLLKRMETLSVGRMPTIGSNLVDQRAVKLIREWIESME